MSSSSKTQNLNTGNSASPPNNSRNQSPVKCPTDNKQQLDKESKESSHKELNGKPDPKQMSPGFSFRLPGNGNKSFISFGADDHDDPTKRDIDTGIPTPQLHGSSRLLERESQRNTPKPNSSKFVEQEPVAKHPNDNGKHLLEIEPAKFLPQYNNNSPSQDLNLSTFLDKKNRSFDVHTLTETTASTKGTEDFGRNIPGRLTAQPGKRRNILAYQSSQGIRKKDVVITDAVDKPYRLQILPGKTDSPSVYLRSEPNGEIELSLPTEGSSIKPENFKLETTKVNSKVVKIFKKRVEDSGNFAPGSLTSGTRSDFPSSSKKYRSSGNSQYSGGIEVRDYYSDIIEPSLDKRSDMSSDAGRKKKNTQNLRLNHTVVYEVENDFLETTQMKSKAKVESPDRKVDVPKLNLRQIQQPTSAQTAMKKQITNQAKYTIQYPNKQIIHKKSDNKIKPRPPLSVINTDYDKNSNLFSNLLPSSVKPDAKRPFTRGFTSLNQNNKLDSGKDSNSSSRLDSNTYIRMKYRIKEGSSSRAGSASSEKRELSYLLKGNKNDSGMGNNGSFHRPDKTSIDSDTKRPLTSFLMKNRENRKATKELLSIDTEKHVRFLTHESSIGSSKGDNSFFITGQEKVSPNKFRKHFVSFMTPNQKGGVIGNAKRGELFQSTGKYGPGPGAYIAHTYESKKENGFSFTRGKRSDLVEMISQNNISGKITFNSRTQFETRPCN